MYRDLRQNASSATVTAVYLTGPPGCGKTQLARQFGEEFALEELSNEPRIVVTLRAQTPESLLESYKELHDKLGIQEQRDKERTLLKQLAMYSNEVKNLLLNSSNAWLLIVDNVTATYPLREFWPTPEENSLWGDGFVLITTQDNEIFPSEAHMYAQALSLASGMEIGNALDLLATVSGISTDEDAQKVAKELGFYPLSLACAAVYVRQMRKDRPFLQFSWKNYLSNLQEYFEHLEYSGFTHHNHCYPRSMLPAAVFSARRIAERNEVLRAAFEFLSYCALQPVPLDIVADYVISVSGALVPDDVKAQIAKCSLLIYPMAGERGIEVVTLHQVMRFAFLQLRKETDNRETTEDRATSHAKNNFYKVLCTINNAYGRRKTDLDQGAIASRILLCPHLKEFYETAEKNQWLENELAIQTMVYYADGLVHVAGVADSYRVTLLERAYAISKQLSCNDFSACRLLCDLGYNLRETGKLNQVIPILEEANRISETQTGPEWMKERSHLLNVLAFTYRESFQLEPAKRYMRLSAEVTKLAYGERHVQVAERLANLGIILHDRWENEEALEVLKEAKEIADSCDASETFIRGQVYNYMAKVQLRWYLGLYHTHPNAVDTKSHLQESKIQHELALGIYNDLHGERHKFTCGVMMTYGMVQLHLGNVERAHHLCQKAFQIYKDSGHIAWPRAGTWLADVLLVQKNFLQAQKLLEDIMKAHKELNLVVSPGAYHPKALLAEGCAHLGHVDRGKQMLSECLQEWSGLGMHSEHYWVVRAREFRDRLSRTIVDDITKANV